MLLDYSITRYSITRLLDTRHAHIYRHTYTIEYAYTHVYSIHISYCCSYKCSYPSMQTPLSAQECKLLVGWRSNSANATAEGQESVAMNTSTPGVDGVDPLRTSRTTPAWHGGLCSMCRKLSYFLICLLQPLHLWSSFPCTSFCCFVALNMCKNPQKMCEGI